MSSDSFNDAERNDSEEAVSAIDPIRAKIKQAVTDVHEQTPLAQSFTNFVTINLVANAQLAAGGTAAMSYLPDDVIATAEIAGSNYINVGTLLPFFKDALPEIAYKLHKNGKTWVLDPVAAGIGETRTAILESFRMYPPTVVRGNASEIIALDAMWRLADAERTAPTTPTTLPRRQGRGRCVRRGRFGDRRRAHVPSARRQRDDDEDHRRRLLARRCDRNVSCRGRAACRRSCRVAAVRPRVRNRRSQIRRPRLLPSGAARCAVERHRRPGGRVRNHRNQLTATFRGWFRTIAIIYTKYIRSLR